MNRMSDGRIDVPASWVVEEISPGLIQLAGPGADVHYSLSWREPSVDIQCVWTATGGYRKGMTMDVGPQMRCLPTSGAPVVSLHGADGMNRLTIAAAPWDGIIEISSGVHEETGEFSCGVRAVGAEEMSIRLDSRPIAWHQALAEVSEWWASLPQMAPMPVPDVARAPVYSTWYSFHQQLSAEALLKQCRLAADLGCESVIVDDGWQTLDDKRGYAYCGDWEPVRLPEMRGLVDAIHELGLKFLLWYSVPYVGDHSRARAQFEGKFLTYSERKGAWTLDPRFPDVREHLVEMYRKAMVDWNLDGFKLDFVDAFPMKSDLLETRSEEMDIKEVGEAVRRLLSEVREALQAVNPEVMIEYRQSYIGPMMRSCGNIFRVGDCPLDGLRNRIGVLDLRVLSGNTAVHSDMVMWHPNDPVASAALQLLNVLFGTLQLSVKLDTLPDDHFKMLRFWMAFMREHADVLLQGQLEPHHPELNYPWVESRGNGKQIVAAYADSIVRISSEVERGWVIHAGRGMGPVVMTSADFPRARGIIRNVLGKQICEWNLAGGESLFCPPIPVGGFLEWDRPLH